MCEDAVALYCTFCHKSQQEVKNLIAGSNVYICNECVLKYQNEQLWLSEDKTGFCYFCVEDHVLHVCMDAVSICHECFSLCCDIVRELDDIGVDDPHDV